MGRRTLRARAAARKQLRGMHPGVDRRHAERAQREWAHAGGRDDAPESETRGRAGAARAGAGARQAPRCGGGHGRGRRGQGGRGLDGRLQRRGGRGRADCTQRRLWRRRRGHLHQRLLRCVAQRGLQYVEVQAGQGGRVRQGEARVDRLHPLPRRNERGLAAEHAHHSTDRRRRAPVEGVSERPPGRGRVAELGTVLGGCRTRGAHVTSAASAVTAATVRGWRHRQANGINV
mmetsp:Transcript_4214/g.16929  ORF Transcript_4214/g.16929 Transcript_4214/m.16929 type:complete len:232 (+) Transcript_4214:395-1090(+)